MTQTSISPASPTNLVRWHVFAGHVSEGAGDSLGWHVGLQCSAQPADLTVDHTPTGPKVHEPNLSREKQPNAVMGRLVLERMYFSCKRG